MKKLICFLLCAMLLAAVCSPASLAATADEAKATVLTLEANSITDVGNRHIKVTWDLVPGANNYQLEIADNESFDNAVDKLSKNRTYWNFAEVPGDVKDTYYVRVRPRFMNDDPDGEKYVYGNWSNVVVAEYKEPAPIPPEAVKDVDWFPWIPKSIDWNRIMSINWSKININTN